MIARFDRNLCTVTQAALPLPNCTALAVTPGQIVRTTSVPACPPALQTSCDQTTATMPNVESLVSIGISMNPAIFVDGQNVFVAAAGSLFEFDRALCLRRQALLPLGNCASVSLPPGQCVAPETLHADILRAGDPGHCGH